MAVPPRVTPRRAEPTDLMKVTPSGRMSFQGRGGGAPPQVKASAAVQQPTPYVGKAAPRTDLLQLAEGLQYFNGEIGKLAYTQRMQWEEGQVEKAKTEAITNPEKVAEVFRMGIDKAVEQGIFPRYAHPKYRFAYLETGAKNMALSGLPAFLQENTQKLGSADSMEPIESTVNSLIDQYADQNGISQMPNAYAAFREQAFPAALRVAAEVRSQREKNFNTAQIEGLDQNITGLTRSLLQGLTLENDNDRLLATDAVVRDIQTTYDNIRRDYPQVDATKQFTSSFISGLNASVTNGELHPREAMAVLGDIAGKLKSGTGAWSDISDVQTAISGAYATWENKAIQLESVNKQKVNEQEKQVDEGILNAFQTAKDNNTFDSLNSTTDLDAIGREVALQFNPELANDPVALRRRVRDLKLSFGETLQKEESLLQNFKFVEDEIASNPQGALQILETMRDSQQITGATYEKYKKQALEASDVGSSLKEGGFDKKLSNIESLASSLVVPKGVAGEMAVLTGDQVERTAELQAFGEMVFRATATELVSRKLNSDPTLKDDPTRRVGVIQEAVNEAYTETTKRMAQERERQKDPLIEMQDKKKAETYGPMAQKVAVLEDAVMQLQSISPSGLTTPQTVDFKVRIAKAPQELRYLAQQIGISTGEEKQRLQNAYEKMVSVVGYGPNTILTGKTEDGVAVDVKPVIDNPMTTPVFRSEAEYSAIVNEAQQGAQATPEQQKDLMGFVQGIEGFSPTAYWDYKQWSIGYGTRSQKGETISKEEAAVRLEQELSSHAERVDMAAEEANIILTEGQRNALISFDFNTGEAVSVINRFAGDPAGLKKKMMEYVNVTENGQRIPSKGLTNRRLKEIALFDSGDSVAAAPVALEDTTLSKLMEKLGIDTEEEIAQFLRQQKALSKQRSL